MNWLIHCSSVIQLDLLVTQNNVITDWEEPLKVNFQSTKSLQNYSSLSKAKKNNLMLNPPFGLKDYGYEYAKNNKSQSRFADGVPNKGDCEYAFIVSAIDLLTDNGKAFLILPNGAQFKDSTRKFRQSMNKQKILDAVIGLPPKIFCETSIPTCAFMIDKNRSEVVKAKGVYMMNLNQAA
jgi:type I restriction-modification system DNA methylase subunit